MLTKLDFTADKIALLFYNQFNNLFKCKRDVNKEINWFIYQKNQWQTIEKYKFKNFFIDYILNLNISKEIYLYLEHKFKSISYNSFFDKINIECYNLFYSD